MPGWRKGSRAALKMRWSKGRVGSNPTPGTEEIMWDYQYIDTNTNNLILVCLCVNGFSEADNQFQSMFGIWPWELKFLSMFREETCIKEAIDLDEIYILG